MCIDVNDVLQAVALGRHLAQQYPGLAATSQQLVHSSTAVRAARTAAIALQQFPVGATGGVHSPLTDMAVFVLVLLLLHALQLRVLLVQLTLLVLLVLSLLCVLPAGASGSRCAVHSRPFGT